MQPAMPRGEEETARAFFSGVLGMSEIDKPPVLAPAAIQPPSAATRAPRGGSSAMPGSVAAGHQGERHEQPRPLRAHRGEGPRRHRRLDQDVLQVRSDGARSDAQGSGDRRVQPGRPGQPGTEVRHPSIELAVGDLLTLTRTWRVVSIEPEQPVVSDLPGTGSGQLAAVLELVAR
jgi:hypothetical protein